MDLSVRCFLCGAQSVGGRRWRLRVSLDEETHLTEFACWPCYSRVSMSGEVRVRREGEVLVVRVFPQAAVPAG